jgi:hypothetical protein
MAHRNPSVIAFDHVIAPSALRRLMRPVALSLLLLFPGLASAGEWSAWRATDNPGVQWRSRVTGFNAHLSAVCEFEFQPTLETTVDFKYVATFTPARGATSSQRQGIAYGITRKEHGGDAITACTSISAIAVSALAMKPALSAQKGISYSVVTSTEISKAALTECGHNDPGFANTGIYRHELREYRDTSATPIRTWRDTVDVFVRCHEP